MEELHQNINASTDVLSGTIVLEQASRGKRFVNYLIDLFFFYGLAILIFAALAMMGLLGTFFQNETPATGLVDRLVTMITLALLWGATEAIFKGKTLGKLITRTRAVDENGGTITAKTAFLRGFSRLVPFDAFSALGDPSYPWHDKWTHTYVIDEKTSMVVDRDAVAQG